MLQSDSRENENRHQNTIKQLEYDNQLLHQTLQADQDHSREQEERLHRDLHIANQQLSIANERLQQERKETQQKLHDVSREEAQKVQQIASLTVNVQVLKDQVDRLQE